MRSFLFLKPIQLMHFTTDTVKLIPGIGVALGFNKLSVNDLLSCLILLYISPILETIKIKNKFGSDKKEGSNKTASY